MHRRPVRCVKVGVSAKRPIKMDRPVTPRLLSLAYSLAAAVTLCAHCGLTLKAGAGKDKRGRKGLRDATLFRARWQALYCPSPVCVCASRHRDIAVHIRRLRA